VPQPAQFTGRDLDVARMGIMRTRESDPSMAQMGCVLYRESGICVLHKMLGLGSANAGTVRTKFSRGNFFGGHPEVSAKLSLENAVYCRR